MKINRFPLVVTNSALATTPSMNSSLIEADILPPIIDIILPPMTHVNVCSPPISYFKKYNILDKQKYLSLR
jgi:hypothetical protein